MYEALLIYGLGAVFCFGFLTGMHDRDPSPFEGFWFRNVNFVIMSIGWPIGLYYFLASRWADRG